MRLGYLVLRGDFELTGIACALRKSMTRGTPTADEPLKSNSTTEDLVLEPLQSEGEPDWTVLGVDETE